MAPEDSLPQHDQLFFPPDDHHGLQHSFLKTASIFSVLSHSVGWKYKRNCESGFSSDLHGRNNHLRNVNKNFATPCDAPSDSISRCGEGTIRHPDHKANLVGKLLSLLLEQLSLAEIVTYPSDQEYE